MQFPYVYGQNISSEYSNVAVSIERITPSIAEKMLETNVRNRSMKKEPLKKAILSGEWLLNGAPIVFSNTGVLLDGQTGLEHVLTQTRPLMLLLYAEFRHTPKKRWMLESSEISKTGRR